jgi:Helicase conserved C-terminal domain
VQVELRDQLDQAQAFIAQLRTISVNSARSTYSQIAWGNRLGTPTAKEKQSQLDAIDAQLVGLKVPPNEIADIQRPFVKMVTLDFFFLFQGVLGRYAALINSKLIDDVHHATDPSAASAIVMKHSDLITAWTKRTQKENPAAELDKEPLEDLLNDIIPKSGEWLTDKECAIAAALLRDQRRRGRSFLICPHIRDLEPMRARLQSVVPDLSVVCLHGRLPVDEIDDSMVSFVDGKADVLLATNIVQSGLYTARQHCRRLLAGAL